MASFFRQFCEWSDSVHLHRQLNVTHNYYRKETDGKERLESRKSKHRSQSAGLIKSKVKDEEDKVKRNSKNRYSVAGWVKSTESFLSFLENQQLPTSPRQSSHTKFISQISPAQMCKVPPAAPFTKNKHKAKILLWSDLTLSDIERLNEIQDYDHMKHVLADIFSLGNYKQNLKSNIVLDLYYYTLKFTRQEHFSPEQTSAYFSIVKKILEVCQETPFGNLDYTYQYFKELLFCHCVNRPPMSVEIFTKEQVISICTYTLNTFFRHFKLYKYVFTPTIRLDLTLKYVGTSPTTPIDAESKETGGDDEEEDNAADEDIDQEEIDFEKIQAQEEFKRIVTDFLLREARKIEGSVDHHLKAAIDSLNAKIDPLLEPAHKEKVKGKKK